MRLVLPIPPVLALLSASSWLAACAGPPCPPLEELVVEPSPDLDDDTWESYQSAASRIASQALGAPFCASGIRFDPDAPVQDLSGQPASWSEVGQPIVVSFTSVYERDLAHGFCHALLGPQGWAPSREDLEQIQYQPLPPCDDCDGDPYLRLTEAWASACASLATGTPTRLLQHWNGWCPLQALPNAWAPLIAPVLAIDDDADPRHVPYVDAPLAWEPVPMSIDINPKLGVMVEWQDHLLLLDHVAGLDLPQLLRVDPDGFDIDRLALPVGPDIGSVFLLDGRPGPVLVGVHSPDDGEVGTVTKAWRLASDASWVELPAPPIRTTRITGYVDGYTWTAISTVEHGGRWDRNVMFEWQPGDDAPTVVADGTLDGHGTPAVWRQDDDLFAALRACDSDLVCVPRVLRRQGAAWTVERSVPLRWDAFSFFATRHGGLVVTLDIEGGPFVRMALASTPAAPQWAAWQVDCAGASPPRLGHAVVQSASRGTQVFHRDYDDGWLRVQL